MNNVSKRLVILALTALCVALNRKLGIGLSEADIATLAGLAAAYIIGDTVRPSVRPEKPAPVYPAVPTEAIQAMEKALETAKRANVNAYVPPQQPKQEPQQGQQQVE